MRLIVLSLLTCLLPAAQSSDTRPEFEVASIKPNRSGILISPVNPVSFTPGGRFTATNVTLVDLIVRCYPTRRIQMQGGPGWIDSERFDVQAKASDGRHDMQYQDYVPMVQMLLEKRFGLKMHRETKEAQVLALVLGKEPHQLRASPESEPLRVDQGDRGATMFRHVSIIGLVNTISNMLHMPVVDRTGLQGFYNFSLEPAPDDPQIPGETAVDRLIRAVREQLGFKLERQKAPVEITTIDHAERPSEN
jgi:uncharacterized protein (TIGR03435 family)